MKLKCTECDFRTAKKVNLKHHMKRHSGLKPFKCPQCDFATGLRGSLVLHIRSHENDRRYKALLFTLPGLYWYTLK